MPKTHKPRKGSLQFWPRKRAKRQYPKIRSWAKLDESKLLGFIGYKAGMISLVAKDLNQTSMTKGKNIIVPSTVIECPPMKILSVRFYKGDKVAKDILAQDLDKELKRKIRPTKKTHDLGPLEQELDNFSDIRLVVYSLVKKAGLKKTPDITELGLVGTIKEKFETAKKLLGKEINVGDVFDSGQLLDVHAVTKGKGTVGPVKRFGITLKSHKSEKGVRRPGSLGPWHPARVTFKVPQAGQLGFFTRVQYNNKLIKVGKEWSELKGSKQKSFFNHYGEIKMPYCIVKGSAGGPQKRPLMLTYATRPTKSSLKQKFEVIEVA